MFFRLIGQNRGSAAILLSLIVSGVVATTIYVSQNTVVQFMSAKSRSTSGWQATVVAQYGLNLGAYLVANNLLLCRENYPWLEGGALCKWTHAKKHKSSSVFSLKSQKEVLVAGRKIQDLPRKALQFTGSHNVEDKTYEYKITFDLMHFKDTSIQSLIGEIPKFLCRKRTTKEVIAGSCTAKMAGMPCKDFKNKKIAGSFCESIAPLDQDDAVVLIKVDNVVHINNKKQKLNSNPFYAAIRRPLANISLSVKSSPKCELACTTSVSGFLFPACRSDIRSNAVGKSPMTIQVTNKGPGVIYALSLLREDRPTYADCDKKPSSCSYKVTAELVKASGKSVLFPGGILEFDDEVDCKQETIYNTRVQTLRTRARWGTGGGGTSVVTVESPVITQHPQPFITASYFLMTSTATLENTRGVCMSGTSVVEGASCPNDYFQGRGKVCQGNKGKGMCMYSHIEPRRVLSGHPICQGACVGQTFSSRSAIILAVTVEEIIPH